VVVLTSDDQSNIQSIFLVEGSLQRLPFNSM
jgi:hypothetical protein